jgi:CRP/FNR family transcriptional regulator, cyclic AMP receptor protein
MTDQLLARFGREVTAGEVLFLEGEAGEEMFVIQTGSIRVSKRVGQSQKTLAILGPGEFVGEMSILNGKPRTATATVVEPGMCLIISAKTLEAMVAKNAEIAMRLIKKLSSRLDSADTLIEILMHQDPRMRVILGLARFAETRGIPEGEGVRVQITPEDLGEEIGVDPLVTEEVLNRLRRLKLLDEDPDGSFFIADPARLHEFLEFLDMPPSPSASRTPPSPSGSR